MMLLFVEIVWVNTRGWG